MALRPDSWSELFGAIAIEFGLELGSTGKEGGFALQRDKSENGGHMPARLALSVAIGAVGTPIELKQRLCGDGENRKDCNDTALEPEARGADAAQVQETEDGEQHPSAGI